jgi:hypothetical protein
MLIFMRLNRLKMQHKSQLTVKICHKFTEIENVSLKLYYYYLLLLFIDHYCSFIFLNLCMVESFEIVTKV